MTMAANHYPYPPAKPRRTAAGIAARSQRGAIGATWWSRRFVAVLESMGHGARLTRGRSYARSGQVLGLVVRPGEVAASVQGTRPKPYSVTLEIDVYSPDQWARVERALAESADYAAELLDGRMPERIEAVFASCGLTLFPVRREFRSDCTCPDWETPCKHVAAACYILAEHFDADPFAMLAWRGRDRATLVRRLEALRDDEAWQHAEEEPQDTALADLVAAYWESPAALPDAPPHATGLAPGAILDRLGPLGVELHGRDVRDLLRPAYIATGQRP
jgi:uncharacterized Zn finger protein